MKRLLITTLIIGVAVAVAVGALHATKFMAGLEAAVARPVTDYASATTVVGEKWQYVFVLLIAIGVAWLRLSNIPRRHSRLLIGLLLIEVVGLSWVCSLYKIFFQPTPSVLALLFAWVTAEGWSAFVRRDRSHLVRTLFADRVSKKEFRQLSDGKTAFDAEPKVYEVSVVVCDVANKFAFEKNSDPVAFADAKGKLIRETTTHLIDEGAYLHAADGEGSLRSLDFRFQTLNMLIKQSALSSKC